MKMAKDDDEITIDFSPIKKLFKRKKGEEAAKEEKEQPQHHRPEAEHAEKHLGHEHHDAPKKRDDEEVSIDYKKFLALFKNPWFYTCLLILIPIIFSVGVRIQGRDLPITEDWARSSIINYYTNQITQSVNSQYPNLPDANKNILVQQQLTLFESDNKDVIEQQVQQTSSYFKDKYRDENSFTYMPDIDPYHYLRYARNILDHGYIGDEIINSHQVDNHMLAPTKPQVDFFAHPYTLAYMYIVMHAFDSKVTPMYAATYFPLLLCALAIIPAFFIGRKIAGNVGGFFTAMMMAVNSAIVSRTTWGHADTDAYNVFFPLLIVWAFIEALTAKDNKRRAIWSGLCGLELAIYSLFWSWWFLFDFMIAALAIYIIYYLVVDKVKHKKGLGSLFKTGPVNALLVVGVVMIAATALFVTIFTGAGNFVAAFSQPLNFISIKVAAHASFWPNVYTTVAELNAANYASIINTIGGTLLFVIALLGLLLTAARKDEHGHYDIKYAVMFLIWFAATIYASTQGVRFTLLTAPALAIGFGACLGIVYAYAQKYITKEFGLSKVISGTILIVLFSLLLIPQIKTSYAISLQNVPIIDDGWYDSLTGIKNSSQPDAIINSWWDFGHHFKYIADRAVTFDGASQNTPMAHWIGKVLLTSDERLAAGILRMLDCGSNNAFVALNKELNDTHKSVNLLYSVVKEDSASSGERLLESSGVSPSTAGEVVKHTHCQPPEDFFITSDDMVGKSGVWSHFGSWNFERAEIWYELKNNIKTESEAIAFMESQFNYTKDEAQQTYYNVMQITDENAGNSWIAGWPSYASGVGQCISEDNITYKCINTVNTPNGAQNVLIEYNTSTHDASIPTTMGTARPLNFYYLDKDLELKLVQYTNDTVGLDVTFWKAEDGKYYNLWSYPGLGGSMFTRMYFMGGLGLEYFDRFSDMRLVTGGRVIVWKVDWQGASKNTYNITA